ncbi:MAG: hypothetical protein WCB87_09300, partial [Methanoregula sp.]|uniref:hypothetical protein n=1 Tax=Methanoregula sp. TaxID=2052170 RepID=UPI003C7838F2
GTPPHGSSSLILYFAWSLHLSECAGNGRRGVANTPLPIIFSSGGYPPPMDLGRFGPDKFRQRGKIAWLLFRTG